MKQVVLSGKGQISVIDVPVPAIPEGAILVRNAFSLISSGTEGAAVASHGGWFGVWEKARHSPRNVERVLEMARLQGPRAAWEVVQAKLGEVAPVGYSSAGTVIDVSGENLPFEIGQRVACMGTGYACHAEYVTVPRNLAVPVPTSVVDEHAAFAALGCIAMHAIRRLELGAGGQIGVIGLGLIGQICIRLLRAMGYEACGLDLRPERVELAQAVPGVEAWLAEPGTAVAPAVARTGGRGLDGVIVAAASRESTAVNLAMDLCAHRGRVVVLGDVGMGVARDKMYRKELELRISCSYGPGRYDPTYEEQGCDYPAGYVRWTERRNLEFFLQLLHDGRVDLRPLVSRQFPVTEADEAYRLVKAGSSAVYGVLFEYPQPSEADAPAGRTIVRRPASTRPSTSGAVRLGIIGTGSYTRAMHLPNLRRLPSKFEIAAVASRSGTSATIVGEQVGARLVTSDYQELLQRKDIDAVLIATRHAHHAGVVLDALGAGKHVFVEKPMATSVEDAQSIVRKAAETGLVLRVGFNRRFSPQLKAMRGAVPAATPRMLLVRANVAGGREHWSNSPEEGGRLLGEGVHFFDFSNWFIGLDPESVNAVMAGEIDVTTPEAGVLIRYGDGSVAMVWYTTQGHRGMGKEYFEVAAGGVSARCDDYRRLEVRGSRSYVIRRHRGDKGQLPALEDFADVISGRAPDSDGADARAGFLATWMAHAAYESARAAAAITLRGAIGGARV